MRSYELTPRVARVLDHSEIRQGWLELLSRWRWDWFCTFTFDPALITSPKGLMHAEKAVKSYRFFENSLNCELFGKRWKQHGDGVYSVLALESHKSGALHMHALVGATVDLNLVASRMAWREFWYGHFGIAHIELPRCGSDVQKYCTKYVSKGGDLVLSPTLRLQAIQCGLDLCRGRTR